MAKKIHVSLDGDDDNIGSLENPIKTIEKAVTLLEAATSVLYMREDIESLSQFVAWKELWERQFCLLYIKKILLF